MNIDGLDYNSKREKLLMPEYGREVQKMVDYCCGLPTKEERQAHAEAIVGVMSRISSAGRGSEGFMQKLWEHLCMMSRGRLDIDYPVDVSQAERMAAKPEHIPYPMNNILMRQFGHIVFEILKIAKDMPVGRERNELIAMAANHIKRSIVQWGQGHVDEARVAAHIEAFTNGQLQIDPDTFSFATARHGGAAANKRRRAYR